MNKFHSKFFEDYQIGEVRQTLGRTITEADIVIHAGQTGDFYPHHMDAEWCKTQPFQQRIAHGTLVFSIGVGMTAGEVIRRHFPMATIDCDSCGQYLSATRSRQRSRLKINGTLQNRLRMGLLWNFVS
jgi:hypothetical protein